MFSLQGQQQQQNFGNLLSANSNTQNGPVYTFSSSLNQPRLTNNLNGFDSTPKKRKLDHIEAGQANNSEKRQHMETPQISHKHSISSCFNGHCQHRSFSSESFSRLLNFFQNDQRNVLKGFCMNCGSSIFEELFHLYEHFRNFSDSCGSPNVQRIPTPVQPESSSSTNVPISENSSQITIKKEPENILEQTDFIDQFDKTNVSDMELDDSITGREVHENTPIEVTNPILPESTSMMQQTIIDETAVQIKKETIERNQDLEATVRMPESQESESKRFVDLNATVMIPNDLHEMSENKKSEDLVSVPTFKMVKSKLGLKKAKKPTQDSEPIAEDPTESMCLDFISKKIDNAKKNGSDKFKNMKPNESIFSLVEDSSDKDNSSTKNQSEKLKEPKEVDLSFNNTAFDNLVDKIKKSAKPNKEGTKFVIEVEDLFDENKNSTPANPKPHKTSKKVEETITKSKSKSSIDNYFSKGSKASTSTKAIEELELNFSDQLLTKIRAEKTPKKATPAKSEKNLKENEDKSKTRKESLRNKNEGVNYNDKREVSPIAAVNLEQLHPKYQTKSSPNEDKSAKTEGKSNKPEKTDNSEVKKSASLNISSSSSHEKSLNTSQKSLNNSQKTLNSSSLELAKHVPYTVDIEALIAKSSSNAELVSIQALYPWINQSITSIMFKTKASLDILLNEYSLFSTYKCMNEFCHYFTTDFEEFKTHAKSHDSINNYCSYCLKNFDKSIDLCNHLDISHKFDRFQCNKCMFRSCQKGYVDVHQRVHHANEENCEVFKSPVQKLLKSDRSKCLPALNKNREKFVAAYRCKTPRCREVFFCKDNYRKHLEMESQKPTCKDFLPLIAHQLSLIDHSKTTSNIEGVYQCLHCSFGTDSSNIFDHMALNHPHEFAYVCKRVKPQKLVELNIISAHETVENSTSIEYFGTTTTEAKSFEGDLEKLNSKNLEKDLKKIKGKKGLVVGEVATIDN